MHKSVQLFLAAILTLCLVISATAEDARQVYTEGSFNYTISGGSVTIVGYFGREAQVTVPAFITGCPVNTVAAGAFTDCENLKTVTLPDSVTVIAPGAIGPYVTVDYWSADASEAITGQNAAPTTQYTVPPTTVPATTATTETTAPTETTNSSSGSSSSSSYWVTAAVTTAAAPEMTAAAVQIIPSGQEEAAGNAAEDEVTLTPMSSTAPTLSRVREQKKSRSFSITPVLALLLTALALLNRFWGRKK